MTEMGIAAGTVIGDDFEIVRPLASGGMGSVFVARQRSVNTLRAVKLMNIGLTANPELRERFEREAKISASIDSDHVVQIIHAGIDSRLGLPFIAMELLDGWALSDYVQLNTPLAKETISIIWSQFCAAMVAAQNAGIVHRDIKPENVFLAKSRLVGVPFIVKVLDFGIAKIVSENHNNTIQAGSPLYMAPEQMMRNATISNRTDVWAMGLVAFFLFVGKHYWKAAHDENAGTGQVFMEISGGPIPAASLRAAEYGRPDALPAGFDDWFFRCVVRDANARFADAAEAGKALANLLGGSHAQATPAPKGSSTTVGAPLMQSPGQKTEMDVASSSGMRTAPATTPGVSTAIMRNDPVASMPAAPLKPAAQSSNKMFVGIGAAIAAIAVIGVAVSAMGKREEPEKEPPVLTIGSEATKASADGVKPAATGMMPATARMLPGMVELTSAPFAIAEDPGRKETLAAFYIDSTEVTVDAYRKCVDGGTCTKAASTIEWAGASATTQHEWSKLCNGGQTNRDNHPINCITWVQADQYCKFVEKRLPTEAEWEYAARGTEGRTFPWGPNSPTVQHANLCDKKCADFASKLGIKWAAFDGEDGFEGTAPVGSFPTGATASGVQDLHGNVAEWTSTSLCKSGGGECGEYVVRGGGCQTERTENVTMSSRSTKKNDFKSMNIGFRCAISARDATRK